ncbi:hypothetical protein DPMN_098742 [Dreissena polymorpha]|uniref:Uncharacterized protein n=1 Tax=Dreissena polymorpha TaxID=45954 RepID=A0A9D4LDM2_DREPO|nr:hypothetical protein DPMN_098742 [Dreissena polymorpha]
MSSDDINVARYHPEHRAFLPRATLLAKGTTKTWSNFIADRPDPDQTARIPGLV